MKSYYANHFNYTEYTHTNIRRRQMLQTSIKMKRFVKIPSGSNFVSWPYLLKCKYLLSSN